MTRHAAHATHDTPRPRPRPCARARAGPHDPDDFSRAFALGIVLNLLFVGDRGVLRLEGRFAGAAGRRRAQPQRRRRPRGRVGRRARRQAAGPTRATPTAGSARRSWRRSPTRCCCWSRWARSPGRRSAGSARRAPVAGVTVMAVAGIGIVVNLGTALLFMRGRHGDLNVRGAFLHMAGDALVSAGVVVAGALAWRFGWNWLDPVASLAIALVIVLGDLEPAAPVAAPAVRRRARRHRPACGAARARGAARRRSRARPARLGHRHDRDRADRASRDAGRPP